MGSTYSLFYTNTKALRGRIKGFTLLELLVVVSIIGLLTAILLPSLSLARRTAYRLGCGSNLRAIGIGLRLYNQDLGRLPPQYDRWGPVRQTYDNRHLEPWISYVAFHQDEVDSQGVLEPLQLAYLYRHHFLETPAVFYCPTQPRSGANEPYTYPYYTLKGNHTWGSTLPIRPNGTPDDKIRVSYHYWLHGQKTLDRLSAKPVVFDNIQHWDSVGHRRNDKPHGVYALFGDAHVNYTAKPALFDLDLWNGGPEAGPWDGPGNDRSLFTAIVDLLDP